MTILQEILQQSETLDRHNSSYCPVCGNKQQSELNYQMPSMPAVSGKTILLPIKLAIPKGKQPIQSETGVFIPQGFRKGNTVDMVIYLHGHTKANTISTYWKNPDFLMREGFAQASKNALLVAPSLGNKSFGGLLEVKGGFEHYIGMVQYALKNQGILDPKTTVRHIILAAHSGGGSPMAQIIKHQGSATNKIKELWCFDSLYQGGQLYADWAHQQPNRVVYAYYSDAGNKPPQQQRVNPTDNTLRMKKIADARKQTNIKIGTPGIGKHNQMIKLYWLPRLKAAAFLDTI